MKLCSSPLNKKLQVKKRDLFQVDDDEEDEDGDDDEQQEKQKAKPAQNTANRTQAFSYRQAKFKRNDNDNDTPRNQQAKSFYSNIRESNQTQHQKYRSNQKQQEPFRELSGKGQPFSNQHQQQEPHSFMQQQPQQYRNQQQLPPQPQRQRQNRREPQSTIYKPQQREYHRKEADEQEWQNEGEASAGAFSGQAKSEEDLKRERRFKNENKAKVVHHNRKELAARKMNRGLF
jgi:hypothetical protein